MKGPQTRDGKVPRFIGKGNGVTGVQTELSNI